MQIVTATYLVMQRCITGKQCATVHPYVPLMCYLCDGQFQEQSAALHDGQGIALAHLHGAQFGAKALTTADGKQVLTAHSLFTVETFAFDKVRLRGAHPPAIEAKYVDLTIPQWVTYFKLVRDSDKDHPKRLSRALEHYDLYTQPTGNTHPDYQIGSAMHCQPTSLNM